jgi:hypothetical protein
MSRHNGIVVKAEDLPSDDGVFQEDAFADTEESEVGNKKAPDDNHRDCSSGASKERFLRLQVHIFT